MSHPRELRPGDPALNRPGYPDWLAVAVTVAKPDVRARVGLLLLDCAQDELSAEPDADRRKTDSLIGDILATLEPGLAQAIGDAYRAHRKRPREAGGGR